MARSRLFILGALTAAVAAACAPPEGQFTLTTHGFSETEGFDLGELRVVPVVSDGSDFDYGSSDFFLLHRQSVNLAGVAADGEPSFCPLDPFFALGHGALGGTDDGARSYDWCFREHFIVVGYDTAEFDEEFSVLVRDSETDEPHLLTVVDFQPGPNPSVTFSVEPLE